MQLGEKISYYRKQQKRSQEELAQLVGVSRQAVSKWELGESTPELDKVVTLARIFSITTNELLHDTPPHTATPESQSSTPTSPVYNHTEPHLGFLHRLVRRYGWLAGVYIALSGLGITAVGGIARAVFQSFFQQTLSDVFAPSGFDGMFPGSFGQMSVGVSAAGRPFLLFANGILILGLIVMLAGIVLSVVLYRNGRKKD